MKTFLKILIARLKSYGTLNLFIMKAMKKTMTKKPMAKKVGTSKIKKYQPGGNVTSVPGMKRNQAKAEEFYDKNPSVRTYINEYTGEKIPTGPMTKKEYQDAAERAADVYKEDKPSPMLKKGGSAKMKTRIAKKTLMKAQKGVETKGSKGGNSSKVIAAISGLATGAAGIAQNIRNKRKTKKAQEELNKMKSEKATTPQAKYGMTMKSKSAKPKAMYGTSMKPGMMNIGGMVNSNTKAAVQKVAKGKVGGKSTAPKTAVPKAKYGMTMKK